MAGTKELIDGTVNKRSGGWGGAGEWKLRPLAVISLFSFGSGGGGAIIPAIDSGCAGWQFSQVKTFL